jgi:hypothetical protein
MTENSTVDFVAKVDIAMRKAAQQARDLARRNGVHLVVCRDGRVVHVPPEQIADLPDLGLKPVAST